MVGRRRLQARWGLWPAPRGTIVLHRKPSAEVIEERRRQRLAASGRIVDGSLIDAAPLESTPRKIIYTYRIAGVTYECSQDVSTLPSLVRDLRLDYPRAGALQPG